MINAYICTNEYCPNDDRIIELEDETNKCYCEKCGERLAMLKNMPFKVKGECDG